MNEEKHRITIYMNSKTWKDFKRECLERDISASQAVDEAIKIWMINKTEV